MSDDAVMQSLIIVNAVSARKVFPYEALPECDDTDLKNPDDTDDVICVIDLLNL